MDILIISYRVVISKNIKNLRKVEDIGRVTVVYHCLQIIYIKEDFLLDRRDLYRNRYYFERNKETIKKNDIRKRQRRSNLGIVVEKE